MRTRALVSRQSRAAAADEPGDDMTAKRQRPRPAPLLVSLDEAARRLAISRDSLDRHVVDELRLVSIGRRLLVPVSELDRFVERNAAVPLAADLARLRR